MALHGPIIYIDDDSDDIELFCAVIKDLKIANRIIIFNNCLEAMSFLVETKEQPFLIICDVNLPFKTGIEFKAEIDANPYMRRKSIPFIFYSTSTNQRDVNDAYTQMTVQGFFPKGTNYKATLELWRTIFTYWQKCKHPNTF